MGSYFKKYELVCEKSATYHISNRISSSDNIAELLQSTIKAGRLLTEHFFVFVLDTKMELVGYHDISAGTLNSTQVHPREVFQAAIATPKSAAVVVAHNHPSGDPTPSREDIDVTRRLLQAGEILGIPVMDHVVVGDGSYTSIRSNNAELWR